MKIIKPGNKDFEQIYEGTCYYCKCEAEASEPELTKSPGEYNTTDYTAKCPTCHRTMYFKYKMT